MLRIAADYERMAKHVEERASVAVLGALLCGFHNAATGRCFPSYERIAEKADCARSTVYEAIHALERAGILTWVNRIVRIREWGPDLFGLARNRWRAHWCPPAFLMIPRTFAAASDPARVMMRQVAGAFAQYEKARVVAKLRAARERKRSLTGKAEGRKSHAGSCVQTSSLWSANYVVGPRAARGRFEKSQRSLISTNAVSHSQRRRTIRCSRGSLIQKTHPTR